MNFKLALNEALFLQSVSFAVTKRTNCLRATARKDLFLSSISNCFIQIQIGIAGNLEIKVSGQQKIL